MLGRYVAGLVLVLGIAMLMAPASPERPAEPEPEPVVAEPEAVPETVPDSSERESAGADDAGAAFEASIADAVEAAIALDQTEVDGREELETDQPVASEQGATSSSQDAVTIESGIASLSQEQAPDETETPALDLSPLAGLSSGLPLQPADPPDGPTEDAPLARAPNDPNAPQPVLLFVTGNNVNIRSGPSTDYAVVGTVSFGEAVELLGSSDGWAQILFGDGPSVGFMARRFLDYTTN